MEERTDALVPSRFRQWRECWQRIRVKLKSLIPFSAGIAAALTGLLIYNVLNPDPQPLTIQEVNDAVAQAMASATPAEAYSAQVYQIIQPSLVYIQTKALDDNGEEENYVGSGVVISDQGEILTALHVVENATEIELIFADGTESSALVVATQPENDIAVLQPSQLPQLLVPAIMGNPNSIQVGDEAFAVGNPFGLYGSISAGVISGLNRSFQASDSDPEHSDIEEEGPVIQGLIQVDTAVNPGNSGGPLLNRDGQVIGIVIGIFNPTEDEFFIGIGFAVPITTAGGAAGAPQY